MTKPTTFVRRGILIEILVNHGFTKNNVRKLLEEGTIKPHEFPGLPKKANERAYYSLKAVGDQIGIDLAQQYPTLKET
ncbi:MAG TPA: hypothetical protein VGQ11_02760 [Candidatus Acidoferrales bacterium]|jgi:hypothetical protein|nr:hypothetical protein [Candidatus Acidoferrales bacterium]